MTIRGLGINYDPAHDLDLDLDLGAYGLVKMIDDEHWKPKEGFHALAAEYAKLTTWGCW